LLKETPTPEPDECDLFRLEPVTGECKVICFHPKTNKTMAKMTNEEMIPVIDAWIDVSTGLNHYKWVQIFENRGKMMGCSNPHPHGQTWATSFLPNLPEKADIAQKRYFKEKGKRMLEVYCSEEIKRGDRIVYQNTDWLVVVPYWATWPYQLLLLPKFNIKKMAQLNPEQKKSFADALIRLTTKYDNLFKCNFPYSMGFYESPNGENDDHWTFHAHFYPPLLRSASIRKFMVGFELMAMPQRDLTAEKGAATLRELPDQHYLQTLTG
jgi:UDPglucose--hexose-1-phosphate uridylyltransferase